MFNDFGLLFFDFTSSDNLLDWKHFKIIPCVRGSISTNLTYIQSMYHNRTTWTFHHWYVSWKVTKSCWRSNTSISHAIDFSHWSAHKTKCSEKNNSVMWLEKNKKKLQYHLHSVRNLIGFKDGTWLYLRWQVEIILGGVMYDIFHSN